MQDSNTNSIFYEIVHMYNSEYFIILQIGSKNVSMSRPRGWHQNLMTWKLKRACRQKGPSKNKGLLNILNPKKNKLSLSFLSYPSKKATHQPLFYVQVIITYIHCFCLSCHFFHFYFQLTTSLPFFPSLTRVEFLTLFTFHYIYIVPIFHSLPHIT
jgi:hypothetical protein